MQNERILGMRKVVKRGGSYQVNLPKEVIDKLQLEKYRYLQFIDSGTFVAMDTYRAPQYIVDKFQLIAELSNIYEKLDDIYRRYTRGEINGQTYKTSRNELTSRLNEIRSSVARVGREKLPAEALKFMGEVSLSLSEAVDWTELENWQERTSLVLQELADILKEERATLEERQLLEERFRNREIDEYDFREIRDAYERKILRIKDSKERLNLAVKAFLKGKASP